MNLNLKGIFQLFQEDKLTNAPKGFDKNHEHIELLKMKSLWGLAEILIANCSSVSYSLIS